MCFSCKPQVPDEYLQPGEFEDVLYDYHLADAMAGNGDNADNESYDVVLYRQAVLRKYGITQAEFDSSLVYYMRHADQSMIACQQFLRQKGEARQVYTTETFTP